MHHIGGSRPYPIDPVRRDRCMAVLADRGMTITYLARLVGADQSNINKVILGRIISPSYEARIADVLGIPRERLFPPRTPLEIERMRRLEEQARAQKERKLAALRAWEQEGAS